MHKLFQTFGLTEGEALVEGLQYWVGALILFCASFYSMWTAGDK